MLAIFHIEVPDWVSRDVSRTLQNKSIEEFCFSQKGEEYTSHYYRIY